MSEGIHAGRAAIVTGGGSGIGRATACLLADEGARVCVADINLENAESVTKEIVEKGGEAFACATDVTQVEANDAMVAETVERYSALDIVQEVCGGAAATVAIGTCAAFGGLPAAAPNPTGALSVADAVPGLRNLINMPACPANGENLAALIVYYVTFGRLPELDAFHQIGRAHV